MLAWLPPARCLFQRLSIRLKLIVLLALAAALS